MIRIPESDFVVGIDSGISEKPGNTIFILAFDVDRFEVTNAEYISFLNSRQSVIDTDGRELISLNSKTTKIEQINNGYQVQLGFERHPVVGVSWYGAKAYAEWVGKRLLTETEWESIARGNNQRLFPWGNQPPSENGNLLNYRSKAPVPIGSYPRGKNPLGIHDLAGNVAEWVTPKKAAGKAKIVRGGSWKSLNPRSVRTTARFPLLPDQMISWVGFRCARDIEN
jgi:formylglycine-generating enzyme required for sulfatase activity